MKKLFPIALLFCVVQTGFAQESTQQQHIASSDRVFKKFKTDVSLGFMRPQSSDYKVGGLFAIEPKYAVMDQLSVGVRLEMAVTARIDKAGENNKAKGNFSYLATGDYYFSNNKFRPFAGLGAGIHTLASVDTSSKTTVNPDGTESLNVPTSTKFGFMVRGGFELGHLRLGVEYNFLEKKNGYLGVKIGAVIGGGRKK